LELLKNFSFIKAKPISPYKAEVLENLNEAVTELNLVSEGKLKARKAEDLFNEL
jgi:DNA-binding protein